MVRAERDDDRLMLRLDVIDVAVNDTVSSKPAGNEYAGRDKYTDVHPTEPTAIELEALRDRDKISIPETLHSHSVGTEVDTLPANTRD